MFTAAVWLPVVAIIATASPEYVAGGEALAVNVPCAFVNPLRGVTEPSVD
jgi:hypothetical protein